MTKIMEYRSSYLYTKRPELVEYLKRNLNNVAEGFDDIGSGMLGNLDFEDTFIAFIAWEAGVPIGWINLTFRDWDSKVQTSVYVHPDWRRKGIGTKLLGKAKKWAAVRERDLCCQPWSPAGDNFYRKSGIEESLSWSF